MRTEQYTKQGSRSGRDVRPFAGAGTAEIAVLGGAIVAGVATGIALNSLLLGFAALIVLALLARLVLALVGMDGDRGHSKGTPAHAHSHEHAGS